ncbi:hypothetical protein [Nocardioides pinisoli]|uniref:Uncharacterized protein n=1 Tax=Nocardioides pinisoli TaxID=2950279 RepID=A0ABT1KYM8_9ACTN|nr:hypothetical protein [Nocardioides pinisoli]MCP3422454.1 hypothetical protein [Nocardioides pinisoli]
MAQQQLASSTRSRHRRSWAVFGGASTVALGACLVAAFRSNGTTGAGLALMGGLIVVGIAAALMQAALAPFPEEVATRRASSFEGGGSDGGGGGDGGF